MLFNLILLVTQISITFSGGFEKLNEEFVDAVECMDQPFLARVRIRDYT